MAFLATAPVSAAPLEGRRTVYLEEAGGARAEVAQIDFRLRPYAMTLNVAMFEDYFLSMRSFRCLEGPGTLLCHVPYPYEIAREVSDHDLTDLEPADPGSHWLPRLVIE